MAYLEDSTDSILTDESASRSSLDIVYVLSKVAPSFRTSRLSRKFIDRHAADCGLRQGVNLWV